MPPCNYPGQHAPDVHSPFEIMLPACLHTPGHHAELAAERSGGREEVIYDLQICYLCYPRFNPVSIEAIQRLDGES
jgi:hypothetical protein